MIFTAASFHDAHCYPFPRRDLVSSSHRLQEGDAGTFECLRDADRSDLASVGLVGSHFAQRAIFHCGCDGRLHFEYSRIRSSTLEYARVRTSMLEYARVRSSTHEYARVRSSTLEYAARVRTCTLEYARVRSSTLEYARVRSCTLEYARVRSSTLEHARVRALGGADAFRRHIG